MGVGKIALGLAAGVLLAIVVLMSVEVSAAAAPAAGGFFSALFADAGFWLVAACVVGGVIFALTRSSRSKVANDTLKKLDKNKAFLALVGGSALVVIAVLGLPFSKIDPKPAEVVSAKGWRYGTRTDKLRGTVERVAIVRSDMPIVVGDRERWVFLEVSSAEADGVVITSEGLGRCVRSVVLVRLDDDPLEYARCLQPSSMPSDTAFLVPLGLASDVSQPTLPIPHRLALTKTFIVEVPTWEGRLQQVEFTTEGLNF